MVDAPGRTNWPRLPSASGIGVTRSARRRRGTALGMAGDTFVLPLRAGNGRLVPVGETGPPPPETGVAEGAAEAASMTWLLTTSTGISRIDCSSARKEGGKRRVISK